VVDGWRKRNDLFMDLNLAALEGVRLDLLGHVRLAFLAAQGDRRDVADPEKVIMAFDMYHSLCSGIASISEAYPSMTKSLGDCIAVCHGSERTWNIPCLWEEVVALMCCGGEEEEDGEEEEGRPSPGLCWLVSLKVQVMLCVGKCQMHTGRLGPAHDNLVTALAELQRIGHEGSVAAVPIYAALGDLLALKHKQHLVETTRKADTLAEKWMTGAEAHELLKREVRRLQQDPSSRQPMRARVEAEFRARDALLKHRKKLYLRELSVADRQGHDLETAYAHLYKAWEIQDSILGPGHAATGGACVSLANLGMIQRDLAEAQAWFSKALSIFEVCFNGYTPVSASSAVALGKLMLPASLGDQENEVGDDALPDEAPSKQHLQQCSEADRSKAEAAASLLEAAATFYLERAECGAREASSTWCHNPGTNGSASNAQAPTGPTSCSPKPEVESGVVQPVQAHGNGKAMCYNSVLCVDVSELLDPQSRAFGNQARALLSQVARVWERLGLLDRAVEALNKAVRAAEASQGANSVQVGRMLRSLGEVKLQSGDTDGALVAFQGAKTLFSDHFGRGDARVKQMQVQIAAITRRARRQQGRGTAAQHSAGWVRASP
ncbi:unnamed protein product, partial [Chrysoparadoxa australica]